MGLQIVVAGSAILERYGDVERLIKQDGFPITARITMVLEGGSTVAMAKTAGLGLSEFTTVFENLDPHIVVIRGDRFEVIAPAIAAAYMNRTIAHIEGGDVTGSIDESVRHAVTKLAHVHFATNEESRQRIIRMGENPRYVFNTGAPDVEIAALNKVRITNRDVDSLGVGASVDIGQPYLMVIQHPVTTEFGYNQKNMEVTLDALLALRLQTVLFWPNVDAGVDEVSHAIRLFREKTDIDSFVKFIKFMEPEKFLALLAKTSCLIGNSSSGIKESSYLGVPVVNIGTRQNGRMRGQNVIDVPYGVRAIVEAIRKQVSHGKYRRSTIYYRKDSSKRIARTLSSINLYTQKKFYD